MQDIQVTLAQTLKAKPQDESKLGFGKIFTDHMFLMNYEQGKGWINPRVVPYGDFSIDPAAMVLHYGQAIFEGTKCYRRADGGLQLFRPMENFKRMSRSAERLCMPRLDEEMAFAGLQKLLEIEGAWVPHQELSLIHISREGRQQTEGEHFMTLAAITMTAPEAASPVQMYRCLLYTSRCV